MKVILNGKKGLVLKALDWVRVLVLAVLPAFCVILGKSLILCASLSPPVKWGYPPSIVLSPNSLFVKNFEVLGGKCCRWVSYAVLYNSVGSLWPSFVTV